MSSSDEYQPFLKRALVQLMAQKNQHESDATVAELSKEKFLEQMLIEIIEEQVKYEVVDNSTRTTR